MATLTGAAVATPVVSTDLVITIPSTGGVARVEQPSANGRGREVFHVSTQTVGRLIAGLESEGLSGVKWVDLLGATTPGIALTYRRNALVLIVSFPARMKTVRHQSVDPRTGEAGKVQNVNFHLPPTVWVLKYAQPADTLANSWIMATSVQIRSITDQALCQNFPFGNSFQPAANVCWGNVPTTGLTSQDPLAADNLFFATGFNDHLVNLDRFTKPDGGAFGGVREWATWQLKNPDTPLIIAPGRERFDQKLNAILGGREE